MELHDNRPDERNPNLQSFLLPDQLTDFRLRSSHCFPLPTGKKIALRYGLLDSNLSLTFAFFINAAMLILAAAVFHFGAHPDTSVADITTAYELLKPAVGSVAPKLFAVGLLASGQQATITGAILI